MITSLRAEKKFQALLIECYLGLPIALLEGIGRSMVFFMSSIVLPGPKQHTVIKLDGVGPVDNRPSTN